MRRRPAAITYAGVVSGAVGLALATAGPTETGCTTHQCDSSTYDYVNGFMEDATTFVTNAMDSQWLDYHGQTTIRIWFPKQVLGWAFDPPVVQVGTDPTPNEPNSFNDADVFAEGVGQLAVYNIITTMPQTGSDGGPFFRFNGGEFGGFLEVTNASCAEYFVRVTVHFIAPDAAAIDGTADAGAMATGAPDATAD